MITRFFVSELYNELYPQSRITNVEAMAGDFVLAESSNKNLLGVDIEMPLKISTPDGEMWEFPVEVLVNIKGQQKRIDRFPLRGKGNGSHKERWSLDDYSIDVKGVLVDLENGVYPEKDSLVLRQILESGQAKIESPILRIWGIERMVFDSWDIPFTVGVPLQEFIFTGKSDNLFDSLLTDV